MPDHQTTIHKDGHTVLITTDEDGDQTVTTLGTASGAPPLTTAQVVQPHPVHANHGADAGATFFMGMIMGAFILWLLQREGRRRRHRPDPQIVDVSQHDVAALARRTATLERIITDPATRTANEIDTLR